MKPTHKTDYTMNIEMSQCMQFAHRQQYCRDEPLTQRRRSYNRGKAKHSIKSRPKKTIYDRSNCLN